MTGFVLILAALQLAVPVRCYQSEPAWEQQVRALEVEGAVAYFTLEGEPHIGLSPDSCRLVRRPELVGANVLAHELGHVWQWQSGRRFDEGEADRFAGWLERPLLRRLAAVFGRPGRVVRPDLPVRLAGP